MSNLRRSGLFIETLESRVCLSASFDDSTAQQALKITFAQDVSSTLTASGIFLTDLANGQQIPSSQMNIAFDGTGTIATITFPGVSVSGFPNGVLPEGNFEAIINHNQIGQAQDESDVFHFLDADFNNDGTVNALDFNALATNYGDSGATYTQGDANCDGAVDSTDFDLLAARFGKVQLPPPDAVTNLAVAQDPNGLKLTWSAPPSGSVDGYRIFRSDDGGQTYTQIEDVPASSLQYVDSFNLSAGTAYGYLVRSYTNSAGDSIASNQVSGTTASIIIVSPTSEELDLSWLPSSATDVLEYSIYRSTDPNFTPSSDTFLNVSETTSYQDTGLTPGTTYYYVIDEVHDDGSQTTLYDPPSGTARPSDPDAPAVPANFSAQQINDLEIQLTWTVPSRSNATGFVIERSPNSSPADFEPIATVGPHANAFTDRFLAPGSSWLYRIAAVNNFLFAHHQSGYTDTGQVTMEDQGYQSAVAIFGGHFEDMDDLDRDAGVSDYPSTENGAGKIAKKLRQDGYNVFLFSEFNNQNVDGSGMGTALNELEYEIEQRGIFYISLIGYSHGGDIVDAVANQLQEPELGLYQLSSAVIIDGIQRGQQDDNIFTTVPANPVNTPPVGMVHGLNIWEPNGSLFIHGTAINGMTNIEVTSTDDGGYINHQNIVDQDSKVRDPAVHEIEQNMPEK